MIGKPAELVSWLFEQDKDKFYEIKEKKEKRTLTQNSYYWSLINELASVMRMSKEEMHFKMLKDYGQREVISVKAEIDVSRYFRYWEKIGEGEVNGKKFNHIAVIMGSSEMDSREFAILIDGVIQECKAVGIPTMTPEEISLLERG